MRSPLVWSLLALAGAAPAHAEPSMVIVVRHAERGDEPAADPALAPAGRRRAAQLADLLAAGPVDAIVSTQFRRTLETAQPLAERLGLTPQIVAARRGEGAAHVPEVLAAVRRLSGRVLVVGHSNTVGPIVGGLSGTTVKALCETSHALLFVVAPGAAPAAVLAMRYGAPDPAATEGCQ